MPPLFFAGAMPGGGGMASAKAKAVAWPPHSQKKGGRAHLLFPWSFVQADSRGRLSHMTAAYFAALSITTSSRTVPSAS